MNVLILTPDRVGSTLLQRVITVYANINENLDPPTINLHELTNGLVPYYNEFLGRTVLGKKDFHPNSNIEGWGYYQNLETVTTLLKNCGHDVTARLAYYHIKNRKDSMADQLNFYQYLNDNFYIIAAKRRNLFEHAMSWAIAGESKKLNVYSFEQKYNEFKDLEKNKINIQREVIEKYLNQYNEYLDWVDRHFNVNCYFEYERDLPNLENFVLNLNVFNNNKNPLTWKDRFNIDWNDWNRMHYLLSLVPFEHEFSDAEKEYMKDHIEMYTQARIYIQDMQDHGIMMSGIPIKLHTLKQKAKLISNIDQCLLNYNNWVAVKQPSYAISYQPDTLEKTAQIEHSSWASDDTVPKSLLTYNDVPKSVLALSDLKWIDN